ncbi:pyridoxamine 5'-phosphate oxidase family protein [Plantactinospora sp. GCM10030261]|uniref:pyridoxamine 5'-phosphate oxidase family protein n=1 Tax=Plantactinospora sp. GCM10030261 TaxID=3273420 RepID=UPI00362124B0
MTPTAELLFRASDATPMSIDAATVKPWRQAVDCLATAPKAWLATVRPDGRPHAMPVMLVLVEGVPCVASRPRSRKGLNLARNPSCVLTIAGEDLDLVVEAEAVRVGDEAGLGEVASAFKDKYGWEFALRDGRVHDDSLPGSPEYGFYRLTPTRAFGYGGDGLTATRWRFDGN